MPDDVSFHPKTVPSRGFDWLGDLPELVTTEQEQALLGALIIRTDLYEQVEHILHAADFSWVMHQRLYGLIGKLASLGKPADPIVLDAEMSGDQQYDVAGGRRYIGALIDFANPLNLLSYAEQISDAAGRRALMWEARELAEDAARPRELRGFVDVVEDHEKRLAELRTGKTEERGVVPMPDAVEAALAAAEQVWKADGQVIGITTGMTDIDKVLGGLHRTDLVIIAGRPGMGKSAFATTVAEAAAATGKHVYFASLEMSADQIAARQLAARSGISSEQQRNGPLSREDISRLIEAGERLKQLPITFDDMMLVSIDALRGKLKRHKRRNGLDLVIIDYLQLIQGGGRRENRVQEISEITRAIKGIAKDFEVPVICLSQLNRAVEQRDDKRPHLADLRDSGSIEQDADSVLFLYREEYYLSQDEPQRRDKEEDYGYMERVADWHARLDKTKNIADIIIAKNRHGATKTVKVRFDAERTTFENLARGAF